MVDAVIAGPLVSIASDGEDGHPRNAGTFSRVLARYVRERGSLTLRDAIRKMSLMPAQRLEKSTPEARRKGRLQEGADADVIVFDPKVVSDRSTYQSPREPSVGMKFVIVRWHRADRPRHARSRPVPGSRDRGTRAARFAVVTAAGATKPVRRTLEVEVLGVFVVSVS